MNSCRARFASALSCASGLLDGGFFFRFFYLKTQIFYNQTIASELLRKSAEQALTDMVHCLFARLPHMAAAASPDFDGDASVISAAPPTNSTPPVIDSAQPIPAPATAAPSDRFNNSRGVRFEPGAPDEAAMHAISVRTEGIFYLFYINPLNLN